MCCVCVVVAVVAVVSRVAVASAAAVARVAPIPAGSTNGCKEEADLGALRKGSSRIRRKSEACSKKFSNRMAWFGRGAPEADLGASRKVESVACVP